MKPRGISFNGIPPDADEERRRAERDSLLWQTLRTIEYYWQFGLMTREDVLQSVKDAVSASR